MDETYNCLKCKAEIRLNDDTEKFLDVDSRLWAFKCQSCGAIYDEDSSIYGQLVPIREDSCHK